MGGSNRKCRVLEPYCSFDILPTEYFNRRQIQLGSPCNNPCGPQAPLQQLVLPQVQCPPVQQPCPQPAQLPCPLPAQLPCPLPAQLPCGGLPFQLGAASSSPLQIGSPFLSSFPQFSSQSFGYNQYQNLGVRPLGFQAPQQSLGRQITNLPKKHFVGSQQIPSVPKFNQQQFQNPVVKF